MWEVFEEMNNQLGKMKTVGENNFEFFWMLEANESQTLDGICFQTVTEFRLDIANNKNIFCWS